MPGYETYRFVGLSEDEKIELICSICQDIFKCPIFTNCCLQTFCKDCIHDWLETNNSCPYDSKPLNKSALTQPPRVFMNILGKLKIRCDFSERGCSEVLFLENLTQHSLSCYYNFENWKKCEKCLCDWFIKSNHDCIKSLLELNKKANEEINALKERKESTTTERDQNMSSRIEDSSSREIRKLKSEKAELSRKLKDSDLEKENFVRTIQELTNKQDSNTTTIISASSTSQLSHEEILREARKHVSIPKITVNKTTKEVTDKIICIVGEEIYKSISLYTFCNNIREKLNQEIGNRWHCTAFYNNMSSSSFYYESGYLIHIEYGILLVQLYKTEYNRSDVENLNPNLIKFLEVAGVSQEKIKDEDTRTFIYNFIDRYGSIEAATQRVKCAPPSLPSLAPVSSLPTPPQRPSRSSRKLTTALQVTI